jgi:hypothetical protein
MAPGVTRISCPSPSRLATPASALAGSQPTDKPGPSTDPFPAQPKGRGAMNQDQVFALNTQKTGCTYYNDDAQ